MLSSRSMASNRAPAPPLLPSTCLEFESIKPDPTAPSPQTSTFHASHLAFGQFIETCRAFMTDPTIQSNFPAVKGLFKCAYLLRSSKNFRKPARLSVLMRSTPFASISLQNTGLSGAPQNALAGLYGGLVHYLLEALFVLSGHFHPCLSNENWRPTRR